MYFLVPLCVCVCVCVCAYALLPCGDAIQADLFICSLICQTRSNDLVTFYRDSLSHCLHPSQTHGFLHTDRHTSTQTHCLLSPKHLQSCRCPPASQNPACPSYKVNEFHATAAATSDYQVERLYGPILINLNHLPEKTFTVRHSNPCVCMPNHFHISIPEMLTSQLSPHLNRILRLHLFRPTQRH